MPPLFTIICFFLAFAVLVAVLLYQSGINKRLNTTLSDVTDSYNDTIRALQDQVRELTRKANTATYDHTNQTGIITAQALRIEELENLAKEQQAQAAKAAAMSEVIRQVKAEMTTYMDVNGRTRTRNPTTKTMAALTALVE